MQLHHLAFYLYGGAVLLAPLLAYAHSTECLQARLEVIGGNVHLDIIADYGMNPVIRDEASARLALHEALRVKMNDQLKPLTDLAPLDITWRYQYDPQSPLLPSVEDTEHQLLGAHWKWPCTEAVLSLAVEESSRHQVLLWQPQAHEPARWVMLLAGDASPVLQVPQVASSPWLWYTCSGLSLLLLGYLALRVGKSHSPLRSSIVTT